LGDRPPSVSVLLIGGTFVLLTIVAIAFAGYRLGARRDRSRVLAVVLVILVGLAVIAVVGGSDAGMSQRPVLGGISADYKSFPWLADVTYWSRGEPEFECTGTIIAPRVILTAGHCAELPLTRRPNAPAGYRIVTGDVEAGLSLRQTSEVRRVILYPSYRRALGTPFSLYDVALLVLGAPVQSPAIALASDTDRVRPGTQDEIVGWNSTIREHLVPTGRVRAPTIVQADKWCVAESRPDRFYAQAEICTADSPRYDTGVCKGDSGGPLINPVLHVEVGIASGGFETSRSHKCLLAAPDIWTPAKLIFRWAQRAIRIYRVPNEARG
jgi:secreted trypsin-like serine protease